MGIKITDMTATGSADGTEIIPTSKAAAPRSVTVEQIKDFVIDEVEAISAGSAPTGADGVFVLQGGALKPVDIDLIAQYVVDAIWAEAAEASPADADKIPLYDASEGAENTVTLAVLAEYIRAEIEAAILDVSDLADGSGTLAVTDYMLVTQGTTAKQITVQDLYDVIYTGLEDHVSALTALPSNGDDADILYVIRSGTAYKVTFAQLAAYVAAEATLDGSGTTDYLAKWSDSNTLEAGALLVDSGTGFSAGGDDSVPTTAAVRGELDELINDQADIGAALVATDTILVDDGANGTQRKSALSRVKTYLETSGVYKTIWVPASRMTPSVTAPAGGPTAVEYGTNDMTHEVLAFAGDTADEFAEFDLVMPEQWDLGTLKYKVYWSATGDANADEWVEFYLSAGARSNDDALDAVLGTAIAVLDQLIADDDMHVTAASAALTVGGTPALGDLIHFKLGRDYDEANGGTAMDVDARVFGVLIQYQENVVAAAW